MKKDNLFFSKKLKSSLAVLQGKLHRGPAKVIQRDRKAYSSCLAWEDNYVRASINPQTAVNSYFRGNGIDAGNYAEQVIIEKYRSSSIKAEYGIPKGSKNLRINIPEKFIIDAVNGTTNKSRIVSDLKTMGIIQNSLTKSYPLEFYWRRSLDSTLFLRSILDNKTALIDLFNNAEAQSFSNKYTKKTQDNTMGFADMVASNGFIYEVKANSAPGLTKGRRDVDYYVRSANLSKASNSQINYRAGAGHVQGEVLLGLSPKDYRLKWANDNFREVIAYKYEEYEKELEETMGYLSDIFSIQDNFENRHMARMFLRQNKNNPNIAARELWLFYRGRQLREMCNKTLQEKGIIINDTIGTRIAGICSHHNKHDVNPFPVVEKIMEKYSIVLLAKGEVVKRFKVNKIPSESKFEEFLEKEYDYYSIRASNTKELIRYMVISSETNYGLSLK